jgi:hypothetical protein
VGVEVKEQVLKNTNKAMSSLVLDSGKVGDGIGKIKQITGGLLRRGCTFQETSSSIIDNPPSVRCIIDSIICSRQMIQLVNKFKMSQDR